MTKRRKPWVGLRRLNKLADYLDSLKLSRKRQFDMSRWFIPHDDRGVKAILNNAEVIKGPDHPSLHGCGTAACAMGYACAMPEFRRLGLRLDCTADLPRIILGERTGFSVAADLFDLPYEDAAHLFTANDTIHGNTRRAVARRLRRYAKKRQELLAEGLIAEDEASFWPSGA